MTAVTTVTTPGEPAARCASVGVSRASCYRRQRPAGPPRPRPAPPRALAPSERQAVLDVLPSDRFVDQSPAEVHATLLEQQTYLCSPRTMYRVLAAAGEVRERRDQARHPAYAKPELVATAPHQIWSWDITKLRGPVAYLYFSLYVILDLFSRYVVGWMGAPRRSQRVAELVADLGLAASHSRPRVSNDNPFSEAQCRTVKSRPEFPDRFGSIQDARAIGHGLFGWYNNAHQHSGLRDLTPGDVHYGRAALILQVRHQTRLAASAAHPERFVQGPPRLETLPEAVRINPPAKSTRQDAPGAALVTPDDPQPRVIFGSHVIVGNRPIVRVNSVDSRH